MSKEVIDRGNRVYNGLPTRLMNQIYDGLISRYGSLEELQKDCHWSILSLYLARACGVVERDSIIYRDEVLEHIEMVPCPRRTELFGIHHPCTICSGLNFVPKLKEASDGFAQ